MSDKHVAIVGVGSIGSAIADMAARAGMGKLTLIDPDDVAEENIARHILTNSSVGKAKVSEMKLHIGRINPDCEVTSFASRFDAATLNASPAGKPDALVAATDSYRCSSSINAYALRENVPAIFGGVWGPAKVAEILYVIPSRTPCYECFASFRKEEREIPHDPRRYTDPTIDPTQVPGQEGLWCNILMAASLQFQVLLGLLGVLDNVDYAHTLWLLNISDYDGPLQSLAVTFGTVRHGCAVCDESKLEELKAAAGTGPGEGWRAERM